MAKFHKFDSGLIVLYENNKINKATNIEICFDCGARCDGDLSGLAHFCEHMMFTGTDKLSKQEITKRYFDFIKANAFTSNNSIVFAGEIVTSRLAEYLTVVQDMICNSTFTPKAVEAERKIITQEIAQDADKHSHHANRLIDYELYKLEHLKNGVLGSESTISKITSKDVKKYIKKYFVKNNCIISVCTPLAFNKVISLIKKHFDEIMPSGNLKPLPYMESKLIEEQNVKLYKKDIDKNFFSIVFKSNKSGPNLKYYVALDVICDMLSDIGYGLTKELRIDNSLIYDMGVNYMINKVNSYLALFTEIGAQNIKPCIDVIANHINRLKLNGFTEEQFKKQREKAEYYWQTDVCNPGRVRWELLRYRFYGRFVNKEDIRKASKALTLAEVNEVVKELFDNAKIQMFVYGDATKQDIYTIKQVQKKFEK